VVTFLRKSLAKQILAISVLSLFGKTSATQVTYFPRTVFSTDLREDGFVSKWYSRHLRTLNEPSLFEMRRTLSYDSYRFLWLRTFHHPVAIRLDLKADGTGVLTTKVSSGAGGYDPGVLTVNKSRLLRPEQVRSVLGQIKDSSFWSLPVRERDRAGEDGSEWIFEGVKKDQYHVVSQWSPKEGPIRKIGLLFIIDLAQMDIPKAELY
jgi:hypothetical protein